MFQESHTTIDLSRNPHTAAILLACELVDAAEPRGMGASLSNTFLCRGFCPVTSRQAHDVRVAMLDGAITAKHIGADDAGFRAAYFALAAAFA